VLEVNATTGIVKRKWGSFGYQDGQFVEPTAIAVSRANEVYVADASRGCVQVFNCNGSFLRKFGNVNEPNDLSSMPNSLAFDHVDNVLVYDSAKCCVQMFSPTGTHALKRIRRCTLIVALIVMLACQVL
jgi:DNA-binding beta-propeller fold protein YncE